MKVGGPVDSTEQVYVSRDADREFLELLAAGEFINIVTSRQMGKTSLVYQAMARLEPQGYRFAYYDISPLRSEADERVYFQTLTREIARELDVTIDLDAFWAQRQNQSVSQGFIDFFREVLAGATASVVIVIDEIDSTLEQGFTDNLFTAIRSMYVARSRDPVFKPLIFCLVGVATPNELVKSHRTTPYNIGRTIWLSDFDSSRDDLEPLASTLNADPTRAHTLFEQVMYWTGGQPYLTAWICDELRRQGATDVPSVDAFVDGSLSRLDRLGHDAHFEATLRFLSARVTNGVEVMALYERVLQGKREPDQVANAACALLKLSGLAKRNADGLLVPRNRIYERLFDLVWVHKSRPKQELRRARRIAVYVSAAALVFLSLGGIFSYTQYRQTQASAASNLARFLEQDRLRADTLQRLLQAADQSPFVWDPARNVVPEQFVRRVGPDVFAEAPWQGEATEPMRLLDAIERSHRLFVPSRDTYGAMSFALEEVCLRSSDPVVRARATSLARTVRDAFIAYHVEKTPKFEEPPLQAFEDRMNRWVALPPGDFLMGSDEDASAERPVHAAHVNAFSMQEHEVTNREYARFDPAHEFSPGQELLPVTNVSWYEAAGYAAWLGASLPTEEQWEYAAAGTGRGGSRRYPWGNAEPSPDRAVYSKLGQVNVLLPVNSRRANGSTPDGLQHMAGNAAEWCRDWLGSYSGRSSLGNTAGDADTSTGSRRRAIRGGAFTSLAIDLYVTRRIGLEPDDRVDAVGFRLVSSRFGS